MSEGIVLLCGKLEARAVILLVAAALLLSSVPPFSARAAAGDLDTSFDADGRAVTDFFGNDDFAYAVAVQSDGRIVVAGDTFDPDAESFDFALARYNTDGSLDSSFGSGGRVATDFFGFGDIANAIAVQSDGRIVAAGNGRSAISGFDDFALARYNSNGSLDTSFDSDGKVNTDFFGSLDQANALAIQSDGRIVVAGQSVNSPAADFALARYNADGSLDASFGSAGKVTTDFFGNIDSAFGLTIQSDNRIVAAGSADPGADTNDFALARYNPEGALDSSFGSAGKITTDFSGGFNEARSIAIQPEGRIVVAGLGCEPDDEACDFAIARYNNDLSTVSFDFCLQDDSNGNLLRFNSSTGDYLFTNCAGLTLGGKGSLTKKGSVITLQHYTTDRRVLARVDRAMNRGNASVQLLPQGNTFGITDRNTTNNTCTCR
jgi:uncharacterized delta-60 repeat protein